MLQIAKTYLRIAAAGVLVSACSSQSIPLGDFVKIDKRYLCGGDVEKNGFSEIKLPGQSGTPGLSFQHLGYANDTRSILLISGFENGCFVKIDGGEHPIQLGRMETDPRNYESTPEKVRLAVVRIRRNFFRKCESSQEIKERNLKILRKNSGVEWLYLEPKTLCGSEGTIQKVAIDLTIGQENYRAYALGDQFVFWEVTDVEED